MTTTREALELARELIVESRGYLDRLGQQGIRDRIDAFLRDTESLSAANAAPAAQVRNQWKSGNEYAPYHPSASHVDPQYRDGWNACYRAANAADAEPAPQEVPLNIIRYWPDGMADRLEHVWKDLIGFIPNYKLYDLQRTLAEFGFTMKIYEGAALPVPMDAQIDDLHEKLATLYIRLSGKRHHASDCATSCAPARCPGPCDCDVEQETGVKSFCGGTPVTEYVPQKMEHDFDGAPIDAQPTGGKSFADVAGTFADTTNCYSKLVQPVSGAVDGRELPPLPVPAVDKQIVWGGQYYTADQMREYAIAALSAHRAYE